jgi:CheY-like chemotaxis protein
MPEPIRVLYVDDDANSLEVRAMVLEEYGLDILTETNVGDAKRRLADTDVDCVLSDLDMPDQDGFDLLEHVDEVAPDLPFILFTSHESDDVIERALEAGVTDYFPKSMTNLSYRLLAHRIRQAVRIADAERALAAESQGISPETSAPEIGVPQTEIDPDTRKPSADIGGWGETGHDRDRTAVAQTEIDPDSRRAQPEPAPLDPPTAESEPETAVAAAEPSTNEGMAEIERETGEALLWLDSDEGTAESAKSVASPEFAGAEADGFVYPLGETAAEAEGDTDGIDIVETPIVETKPERAAATVGVDESGSEEAEQQPESVPMPGATAEPTTTEASSPDQPGGVGGESAEIDTESGSESEEPIESDIESRTVASSDATPVTELSPKPASGGSPASEESPEPAAKSGADNGPEADRRSTTEGVSMGSGLDGEAIVEESSDADADLRPAPEPGPTPESEAEQGDTDAPDHDHDHRVVTSFEPEPGEGVLVECGSQDDRKGQACLDLLGLDSVEDRNVLLIRYRRIGSERLERIAEDARNVHLISIGYQQSIPNGIEELVETTRISNPSELTRLGIVMTRVIGNWDSEPNETVVCLDSLDILMGYTDERSVFRFLHVLLSKLQSTDAIAHFHIEPAQGSQAADTLKPLFDTVVTIDADGVHVN